MLQVSVAPAPVPAPPHQHAWSTPSVVNGGSLASETLELLREQYEQSMSSNSSSGALYRHTDPSHSYHQHHHRHHARKPRTSIHLPIKEALVAPSPVAAGASAAAATATAAAATKCRADNVTNSTTKSDPESPATTDNVPSIYTLPRRRQRRQAGQAVFAFARAQAARLHQGAAGGGSHGALQIGTTGLQYQHDLAAAGAAQGVIGLATENPNISWTSLEADPVRAGAARCHVAQAHLAHRITVLQGAYSVLLERLQANVRRGVGKKFGFVYIDAAECRFAAAAGKPSRGAGAGTGTGTAADRERQCWQTEQCRLEPLIKAAITLTAEGGCILLDNYCDDNGTDDGDDDDDDYYYYYKHDHSHAKESSYRYDNNNDDDDDTSSYSGAGGDASLSELLKRLDADARVESAVFVSRLDHAHQHAKKSLTHSHSHGHGRNNKGSTSEQEAEAGEDHHGGFVCISIH